MKVVAGELWIDLMADLCRIDRDVDIKPGLREPVRSFHLRRNVFANEHGCVHIFAQVEERTADGFLRQCLRAGNSEGGTCARNVARGEKRSATGALDPAFYPGRARERDHRRLPKTPHHFLPQ